MSPFRRWATRLHQAMAGREPYEPVVRCPRCPAAFTGRSHDEATTKLELHMSGFHG